MPLFKMAALEKIKSLAKASPEQNAISVKYQVLAAGTAMVGVLKQKKKATGELVQSTIKMGTVPMSA